MAQYFWDLHDAAQRKRLKEALGSSGNLDEISQNEFRERARRLVQLGLLWQDRGKVGPRPDPERPGSSLIAGSDLLAYAAERGSEEDRRTLREILDASIPLERRGLKDEEIAERAGRLMSLVDHWTKEGKLPRRARPGGPIATDDLVAYLKDASPEDRREFRSIMGPVMYNSADAKAFKTYMERYAKTAPKERSLGRSRTPRRRRA